jgi:alcohol dehydrogenase
MVCKLPDGADPGTMAGAADNVTDGYRAVAEPLRRHPGADVLVVGGLGQSIGMYAALAARVLGAGRVVYLDADPVRLERLAATGIEVWERTLTAESVPDVEFPVTVEASATQEGLTFAIRSTAPSGFCSSIVGGVQETASIPRMDMFGRGITLDISRAQLRRDIDAVIGHVHVGDLDPLGIADPALRFDDAATALFEPSPKLLFLR